MAYILKLREAPDARIHHGVGGRRRPGADVPTAGTGCVSLAPRRGSSSISNVGTSTSAGAAATTMAARQPCACASGPLEKYASAPPNGTPNMNNASTRERLSAGKRSPSQLVAAGAHVASPSPTPTREIRRIEKFVAIAAHAVSDAHTTNPQASSFLRLPESAMRPSGTPIIA